MLGGRYENKVIGPYRGQGRDRAQLDEALAVFGEQGFQVTGGWYAAGEGNYVSLSRALPPPVPGERRGRSRLLTEGERGE